MSGDEGWGWQHAVDGPLHLAQVFQVLLEDFYLRAEPLSLREDLIEVELLEIFLLFVEVGTVLVDVLIDHLDGFVLYHVLQFLLQLLHPFHDVPALLDALALDLVEGELLFDLFDALLEG